MGLVAPASQTSCHKFIANGPSTTTQYDDGKDLFANSLRPVFSKTSMVLGVAAPNLLRIPHVSLTELGISGNCRVPSRLRCAGPQHHPRDLLVEERPTGLPHKRGVLDAEATSATNTETLYRQRDRYISLPWMKPPDMGIVSVTTPRLRRLCLGTNVPPHIGRIAHC